VTVRLTAIITGRVQGVGFRYFVRRCAEPLALVGTATNCRDGSVQVIAEGARTSCEQLLAALRSDAAPGYVSAVDVTWSEPRGGFAGFRER
jgi:acylphosphatase